MKKTGGKITGKMKKLGRFAIRDPISWDFNK